ncbi:GAF domain-containing protein [Geminocystis herdmanii]|uniref:GAF domain-containing protein n=1 Tax=Geminocystis herdmanii TaxID=669359 RepID=UPI00034AC477|nr:GAF domain-containing protein [Geminocystis herdmanii]
MAHRKRTRNDRQWLKFEDKFDRLEAKFDQFSSQVEVSSQINILTGIISKIRRTLNLDNVFNIAATETRKLLKADRVAIYKFNHDDSGQFIAESVADGWVSLVEKQEEDTEININISDCSVKYLNSTDSVSDTYLQQTKGSSFTPNNSFRVCNDIYQAGFSRCYLNILERYQARAYAIVAIYDQEKLWGLLAVYQNSSSREWQKIEIHLLSQISDHLGIAITQAELLKTSETRYQELQKTLDIQARQKQEELIQETKQEKALAEVIDKIRRTLDLDTIFDTVTKEVRQLFNADRVAIFHFHDYINYHDGKFVSETIIEPYQSTLNQNVFDRCFGDKYATSYQEGNYLALEDIYKANLSDCHISILSRFQVRANLVLPINQNKQLWGLLCVHQCSSPRQWKEAEIEFLKKITIQLGVALQQADLFYQQKKRTEELQIALAEVEKQKQQQILIADQERTISHIIESMRSSLDIEKVLQTATNEIRQALECDRTAVYRFNGDWSGEFIYESMSKHWTPLNVANTEFVWTDTYLQETQGGRYAHHETFAVENIYTVGHETCHIQILEMFEIKAYMIAPIFAGEKLWGLLAAYQNTNFRYWYPHEINLIKRIGEQLGVALQHANLLQQLATTSEKAQSANNAKSEFLANMSHELRTPLNAILGFTNLLNRDANLNYKQKEYLNIIARSGEHLLTLLSDVLEMSKIEAGKIILNQNDFDLYFLLQSLKEMFELKAQLKGLSLNFHCAKNVPQFIHTDENKLRQILINLLSNGIKFTEQGEVNLYCSFLEDTSNLFPRINFTIEDTGLGIEEQEMNILFEPFIQTASGRKSQEGTGLGLPISKKFIKLMGGEINVKSKLNQGSIFQFFIPVKLIKNIEIKSVKSNKIIGFSGIDEEYRILIVDDKLESRLILLNLLSEIGFVVKEAQNGQEAVILWETWQPHLIWMDMRMPVLNGYEATKIIRQQQKPDFITKIIALTANAFERERSKLLQAGCDDFVPKPFREEMIYEKIVEHLDITFIYESSSVSHQYLKESDTEKQYQHQLMQMNPQWREKLYQSALTARENQLRQLVKEIEIEHPKLAEYLLDLINKLLFDKITQISVTLK